MTQQLFNKPKLVWNCIDENNSDISCFFFNHHILIEHKNLIYLEINGRLNSVYQTIEEAKQAAENYCQQLIIDNCLGIEIPTSDTYSNIFNKYKEKVINQGYIHE